MISNLPRDLIENVLSRVPLTHLKTIRSTCKTWNALSKDPTFAKQHINKATTRDETQFLMITSHSVSVIGINLHLTRNTDNNKDDDNSNVDLSIEFKGKVTCDYQSHKALYDHRNNIIHCKGRFGLPVKLIPMRCRGSNFLNIVEAIPALHFRLGTFLVDEEKKIVVGFSYGKEDMLNSVYDTAHIIRENCYYKRVDLRESPYTPLLLFARSYVPSCAQIK
ncbi:unnamed protein product [Cochlearia groenlandica]